MGLIEKRLIKQGQDEWIPEANKDLQEITGGQHTFDVDWKTFETDEVGLNNVRNQGIRRITSAFRLICADDLGKEVCGESIKTVQVRDTANIPEKGVSLKDGVLTVQCAFGKGSDGFFVDTELVKLITKLCVGLTEKRLIKKGQDEWVPEANKDLHEITGGPQTYDVDWKTFETDEAGLNNVQYQGIRRITSAIRVICGDDLSKEACVESIKTVQVRNTAKIPEKGVSLKDGVLTVQCAFGKGSDGFFVDTDLVKLITKLI
jgi:predicted extracellular nuclease